MRRRDCRTNFTRTEKSPPTSLPHLEEGSRGRRCKMLMLLLFHIEARLLHVDQVSVCLFCDSPDEGEEEEQQRPRDQLLAPPPCD